LTAARRALEGIAAESTPAAGRASERLAATALLAGLVVLAVGLRLQPLILYPSTAWADEVFQAVEPAHRLVYGYGLVPWEFQLGMRSWLLPGTIAGLLEATRLWGAGPQTYLPFLAVSFGLLACGPVICTFLWCRGRFGLAAALAGGLVPAIAPEMIYFGARTLSEVVAAHMLMIACYVIEPDRIVASRRRLFAAGLLLGLVCLLRLQLAPAVAVMALWWGWQDPRARLPAVIAGGAAALMIGGGLDWMTLGYPFASVWRNIVFNGYIAVGSDISISGWSFYMLGELGVWGAAGPFLLLLIGLGARQRPALFLGLLTMVAVHSAIPHKEWRFIYPAVVMAMVLAGIGTALAVAWAAQRFGGENQQSRAAAGAAALLMAAWCGTAWAVWHGGALAPMLQRDHDNLQAMSFARSLPEMCGLGIYGWQAWDRFGGYTHLHRPVPMFWPKDEPALSESAAGFNTVLYRSPAPPGFYGYKPLQCFGEACVATRPGACEARPEPMIWYPPELEPLAPPPATFAGVPAALRPGTAR